MAVQALVPGLVRDLAHDSRGGADADLGVLFDLDAGLDDVERVDDESGGYAGGKAGDRLDDRGRERDAGLPAFERRVHPRHHCGGGGGGNCCDGVVGRGVIIVGARAAWSVRGRSVVLSGSNGKVSQTDKLRLGVDTDAHGSILTSPFRGSGSRGLSVG